MISLTNADAPPAASSAPMIHAIANFRMLLSLAGVAAMVALATGGAQSAATRIVPSVDQGAVTFNAEQMFADAPDGVDPIVTGPVSTAFRQQQAEAGCESAVWPHIPARCYPD